MEEEVTKLSLGRYKVELEQKQLFLKNSKKYDEQNKELKSVLGYVTGRLGVKNVPEYLQDEVQQTISELNVGKDLQKLVDQINKSIDHFSKAKSDTQEM